MYRRKQVRESVYLKESRCRNVLFQNRRLANQKMLPANRICTLATLIFQSEETSL
jgi:hypothetical protein